MAAIKAERYWTVGSDCGEQKHRFVMLDENDRKPVPRITSSQHSRNIY